MDTASDLVVLQILDNVIKHRWGAIDDTQREGIKNYLSNLIIKISSNEVTLRREKVYLNKLNIILVQVSTALISDLTPARSASRYLRGIHI